MAACFENEDILSRKLTALYEGAGYSAYKVRKFEEYSLYIDNRNFLSDQHIITFTDNRGRLLALKPDITLSIMKNQQISQSSCEKLYYRESVYRFDKHAGEYREIDQIGLEVIGQVGLCATLEVLQLALDSLSIISPEGRLAISHMGLINAIMQGCALTENDREDALVALKNKSRHELSLILEKAGVCEEKKAAVLGLLSVHTPTALQDTLKDMGVTDYCRELLDLFGMLKELGYENRICFDFSVTQKTEYYNGLVFLGFVPGLSRPVLSGGRYDTLAKKFHPGCGAIGFAVYTDELLYHAAKEALDVEVLLIAPEEKSTQALSEAARLRGEGNRVRVEAAPPRGLRYGKLIEL